MSLETLQRAQIHNADVELQQLVTKRLAMVAANHEAELRGESPKYLEADFDHVAELIGYTALPQDHFR